MTAIASSERRCSGDIGQTIGDSRSFLFRGISTNSAPEATGVPNNLPRSYIQPSEPGCGCPEPTNPQGYRTFAGGPGFCRNPPDRTDCPNPRLSRAGIFEAPGI